MIIGLCAIHIYIDILYENHSDESHANVSALFNRHISITILLSTAVTNSRAHARCSIWWPRWSARTRSMAEHRGSRRSRDSTREHALEQIYTLASLPWAYCDAQIIQVQQGICWGLSPSAAQQVRRSERGRRLEGGFWRERRRDAPRSKPRALHSLHPRQEASAET